MITRLNYNTVSSEISSCDESSNGVDSIWHTNSNMNYGYLTTDMYSLYDTDSIMKLLVAIGIEMSFGDYLQGVIIDKSKNQFILKLNKLECDIDEIRFGDKLEAFYQFDYFNLLIDIFENEGFLFDDMNDSKDVYYLTYYYGGNNFVIDDMPQNEVNIILNDIKSYKCFVDYHCCNVGKYYGEYIFFDPFLSDYFSTINKDANIMTILQSYKIPFVYIGI